MSTPEVEDIYRRASRVDAHTVPTAEEFADISGSRTVTPVVRQLMVDDLSPVGLYRALTDNRPGTFLLESAENGRQWSRYSFIGVNAPGMLTEVDGRAAWVGEVPAGLPDSGRPLDVMRDVLELLHSERIHGLPPLTSGLVGMIGYDAVRHWERLPDSAVDDLHLPDIAMLLVCDLAVVDHHRGSVLLVANVICTDPAQDADSLYADALRRLDQMQADLTKPQEGTVWALDESAVAQVHAQTAKEKYQAGVEICREHIRAGDAFQIVLSQRFETDVAADSLDVYRVLRVTNPSPYMYLIRFPAISQAVSNFDVVGSSPEALVTLTQGRAMLHPIAGTRPRGKDAAEDAALAEDLLADEKERAEHLMLVDLGRNDLGRVSAPGSVEVVEFMNIERYSHVIHIVSTVVSQLAPDKSAYDLLAATFPAGTLSGAPKHSAMSIIDELEPTRRGLYGGCVGYLDFAGDLDTAIAIRTAVIRDGRAFVQAGAGLVADSDPATEQAECENKAAAVLRAVAIADSLLPVGDDESAQ